jgi:hypothetical protein
MEHVGGVTGDEHRSRPAQVRGGRTHVGDRRGNHVRAPVSGRDHHVGAELGDALDQPVRGAVAQVCVRDPRPVAAGGEVRWVIGDCDDAEAGATALDDRWRASPQPVGAGTDRGDAVGGAMASRRATVRPSIVSPASASFSLAMPSTPPVPAPPRGRRSPCHHA